jgi:hypothetical protein
MSLPKPTSLVAEKAVRLLRRSGAGVNSCALARELLTLITDDEAAAYKLLFATFGGDPRLTYENGLWRTDGDTPETAPADQESAEEFVPDRVLVFIDGARSDPTLPYELTVAAALRLHGDEVIGACGGDTVEGAYGDRLRRAMLELLDGAIPVTHATRAATRALEQWLGEPLHATISLRRLGRERVGLPLNHDLEQLVARLGLDWREAEDPLEMADTLDRCLEALRRSGEPLNMLRDGIQQGIQPIDWSRFAFNREFLRHIPAVAGTYRFYDKEGSLTYVGKSKNLQKRVSSYFREDQRRPARVQRLLDATHRIEYEAAGSELEAMLREAEQIRRDAPSANVQVQLHPQQRRSGRLHSILILEPAAAPDVLLAFVIRHRRLIGRIAIGPRGGGLALIQRLLDDHFFETSSGPTTIESGPDLDVELVARWLAKNRDRAVAFDPTDLASSEEVIDRLRWFLKNGSPFDPDGAPIDRR